MERKDPGWVKNEPKRRWWHPVIVGLTLGITACFLLMIGLVAFFGLIYGW